VKGQLKAGARHAFDRLGSMRGNDDGSASLEFVVLGVLLLVPLAYLMITVFSVQNAAYGVSAASREAGRAFVQAPAGADPLARAYSAAWIALQDHGIDLAPEQLSITCSAAPCLTPGAAVSVRVDILVGLPWVPELFGEVPASVAVHGEHTAIVDRFRSGGGG
jgi:Flp pilus assembly protein TadG